MKLKLLCLSLAFFLFYNLSAQYSQSPSSKKMELALLAIKSLYVDDVNEDKLVEDGLRAIVKDLDPHSSYMTADEMKDMNEPLQGGFDGIGISFNMMNDTLFVVEVIAGGPSEKAGLVPGDRIIKVNGESIAGVKMPNSQVMKRLKGPKGTTVDLDIKRRGKSELLRYRIIRDKIPFYSIDASFMIDKKIGYILISRFGANTIDEFHKAFKELQQEGMTDLIIDLQSNGGGLMNAAVELADEFLSDNKCIVYTEGKHSPRMQDNATKTGVFEKGKLIILIDEYSASASEIVSGAIQDWDRGIIVGRRSFGKGLVQRPIPLPDGSFLKLTVSRYFTPSGRFIQKPYDDMENYSMDVIERYNRGEMIHADSIHFPDSLRTYTLVNKRTIYGGGGIMPDVFVPMDTSRFSSIHKKLSSMGVLNRFSLQYVDLHRKELLEKYPDANTFIKQFSVNEEITQDLLKLADKEKVILTDADKASDKALMLKQLKADFARDLWKTSDYYKVMWDENESLMKAIEILKDKKQYDKILTEK
jgi:carboxyl-terminal processing protease